MHNKPPWDPAGTLNEELSRLYQESSLSGDMGQCGFSIDGEQKKTCGSSRWGCWTCTLVDRDKSVESFIANNREELRPLAEFREELVKGRDLRENRYLPSLRTAKDNSKATVVSPRLHELKVKVNKQNLVYVDIDQKGARDRERFILIRKPDVPVVETIIPQGLLNDDCLYFRSEMANTRHVSIPKRVFDKLAKDRTIGWFSPKASALFFVHEGRNVNTMKVYTPAAAGYTLAYRKYLLDKLLETERKTGEQLITEREKGLIREIWAANEKAVAAYGGDPV